MKSEKATMIRGKVIHNLFNSSPLETPPPGVIAPERRASPELRETAPLNAAPQDEEQPIDLE